MSISNLLIPNNENLFCNILLANEVDANTFNVTNLTTDNLDITNNITCGNNISCNNSIQSNTLSTTSNMTCGNILQANTLDVTNSINCSSLTSLNTVSANSINTTNNIGCANITASNNVTCNNLTSSNVIVSSYGLFDANNVSIGSTITLKFNNNGVCNLYYDSKTSPSNVLNNTPFIRVGNAAFDYGLVNYPEMQCGSLDQYNYSIYVNFNNGTFTECRLSIVKIDSLHINITILSTSSGANLPNQSMVIEPFCVSYPIA